MARHEPSAIRIIAIRQPFAVFDPRPWQPPLNIYETDTAILLHIELAGVDSASLEIEVQPMQLRISGNRQLPVPEGLRRLHRMEIVSGPFRIQVPLNVPIDPATSEARCVNGLLAVRLPFARQTLQRVVVIRVGEGGLE